MAKRKKKKDCGCDTHQKLEKVNGAVTVKVKDGFRLFLGDKIYIRNDILKVDKSELKGQECKVEII